MKFKLFASIVFFVFLIYGCSGKNGLELKTESVSQELNQVSAIGANIGNIPPDFTVVTTDGRAATLSDFTEQQKPVIVYFMATWCPYCAEDYAELSKSYPEYEKNASFLSISLDLSEDLNLLREYKKKYPKLQNTMFAAGQSRILVDYRVTKTTTKFAIGKNGKIIYAGYGVFNEGQWRILLNELSK